MSLRDKVVMITGGASGIGAATARAFSRAGASVGIVFHASSAEAAALVDELTGAGGRAVAVRADCGDDAAVRRRGGGERAERAEHAEVRHSCVQ